MEETPLGGNLNDAVRVGDTVRRTTGPWTPAVHALLRYLEKRDFPAPRVRGIDEEGREILEYVPGEAHSGTFEPLPDRVMDEQHVVAAAKLLRRYHDVVADFRAAPDATWRLLAPTKHEVICHNDWTPWNALFLEGRLSLMLDWDLAGPGSRVWGVVNAVLAWAPIYGGHGRWTMDTRMRRLGLFLDAYGLEDRREVFSTMRLFLQHVGRFVENEARRGDRGMRRLVEMGVPQNMYEREVRWLDEHQAELERALQA